MTIKSIATMSLLLAGLVAAAATPAQQNRALVSDEVNSMTGASATSNVPPRSGEASTMTNGVPNLSTSNPQPGELGIQGRLTVRRSVHAGAEPDLKRMGAAAATSGRAGTSPTVDSGAVR